MEGNPVTVIGIPPEDMVTRVFLTKPDERGNMKRARVTELIRKFDSELDRDLTRCKFRIEVKGNFEGDDSDFEDIMSYNKTLDYVERERNNEDGEQWKFRKVSRHSIIVGKNGGENVQEV